MGISVPAKLAVVMSPVPLTAGNWNGSQDLRSFRLMLSGERLLLDPQLPRLNPPPDTLETFKWEQYATTSSAHFLFLIALKWIWWIFSGYY